MGRSEALILRIEYMRKLNSEIVELRQQLKERMRAAEIEYKICIERGAHLYEELDVDLCRILGDIVLDDKSAKEGE